jgi:DeoR/GlpR family transcriptional regulator of sugar metabolism
MKKMRTYDIIDYVKSKKRASLTELMKKFNVSSATIHRDVAELVASGHLERIRGGVAFFARSAESNQSDRGITYLDRATINLSAKKRIASKAIELVADGDILFLDSSTTTAAFAEELANHTFVNLTIVTNSVAIMEMYRKMPRNYVLISLGGNYDSLLNSFLGSAALRELERLTITKAFVSSFGVNDKLVTTNHEHQAGLITKVLDMATKRYLLVDRSKFGRTGIYRLATRAAFDEIISDDNTTKL